MYRLSRPSEYASCATQVMFGNKERCHSNEGTYKKGYIGLRKKVKRKAYPCSAAVIFPSLPCHGSVHTCTLSFKSVLNEWASAAALLCQRRQSRAVMNGFNQGLFTLRCSSKSAHFVPACSLSWRTGSQTSLIVFLPLMPSLSKTPEKKSVTILFCLFSFNGTSVHVMETTTNHFSCEGRSHVLHMS